MTDDEATAVAAALAVKDATIARQQRLIEWYHKLVSGRLVEHERRLTAIERQVTAADEEE